MRVKTLILPALAVDDPDQPDPLGRAPGEALWEQRWTKKKLENNKKILGDYEFSALYQQTPVVRGGSIFIGEPARFVVPNLENARLIIYVDTASSKKTSADHTAITVMAVRGTRENWTGDILEVIRRRLTITELVPVMQDVRKRWQCTIAFELTAQSLPIIQHLEDKGFIIRKDTPDGDKFSRAVPYAAAFNNGSIRVPANAPWVSNWLSEHHAFTGLDGDTDDQVDSGGGAWRLLTRKQGTEQAYA
jgi:predicted phage terminase large subunit-like protein